MSAKVKAKYEILRVSGNGYMIDDPNGCEVVYRETSQSFSTRRGDEVTYLLERIDELEEANEQLEAQVEELKDARDTCPWQPIETAPKDGTPVLACLGQPRGADWTYRGGWEYEVARFLRGGWCVGGNEPMRNDPTHWMPIPKLEVSDV